MSKIGDLFVRLGLKKDDFSKGMDSAKKELSGFGRAMSKVSSMSVAAWAAIAAGAVAMADKFAHTSQRFGDVWDRTMSGMKSSWQAFIRAVNSGDWEGLGRRIKNAFQAGREAYNASDAEMEVLNSIRLRRSDMEDDLAKMEIDIRNRKLTADQRVKIEKDYLDKIRPLYEDEAAMRQGVADANIKNFLSQGDVPYNEQNARALKTFLTQIAPDGRMVGILDQYNRRRQGKKYNLSAEELQAAERLFQGMDYGTSASLAAIASAYQSASNEQINNLVDSIVASNSAAGAFNRETKRIQQIGNSLEAGSFSGVGGSGPDTKPQEDPNAYLRAIKEEVAARTEVMREVAEADAEVAEMDKQLLDEFHALNPEIANFRTSAAIDLAKQTEGVLESVQAEEQAIQDAKDKTAADLEDLAKRAEEAAARFKEAVVSGFSAGMQELMDQLFGISEVNPGAIFQALMEPLADLAVREGEILMAQGIGIEACKEALESLNGYAAITAGAALIAIGAAAKSGLKALASAGASSTGTYSSGYSSPGATDLNYQTELTVYVKGTLSGRDIVLSGQRTMNDWGR